MTLQRWLQWHTALLAVLGAAFLFLAGDRTPFPWVLGGGALLALFVTDAKGWVRLPRTAGNLAALVAVAWTFREFWRQSNDREAQLFTISHMLIYLQVTLLFQAKSRRLHWQLMVLSALQVVVAAALSIGPQFGVLLAAYLAVAVGSMLLLCLQRELPDEPVLRRAGKPNSLMRLLERPRLVDSSTREAQLDQWFRAPWLVRGTLVFTLTSLAISAAFFITAPRLSEAMWLSARGRGSSTGFSGEVLLKSKGNIRLSEQPVMRVSFSRVDNGQLVPLATEPYFHGQVLTTYRSDQYGARWSYESSYRNSQGLVYHQPEAHEPGDVVRQEIVLESLNTPIVFAMMPVVFLPETPKEIREHRRSPKLIRHVSDEHGITPREFRFAIGTLAIKHSRQVHAVPHFNPATTLQQYELSDREREELRQFDDEQFPGLKRIADDVIRDARAESGSALQRALALQQHLYSSRDYQYSLEFDDTAILTPEQLALDPLERFVVYRKKGHCEYFASALVMMLRSQGIPARMVVGYKGGEWNPLGEYYIVKQKHAHAWVEVLLPAEEVPLEEIAGKPSRGGAWFRLDPTPIAWEGMDSAQAVTLGGRVTAAFDYADYLWRDYVMGLNSTRQDTVLDPITSRSRGLLSNEFAVNYWQRLAVKTGMKHQARHSPSRGANDPNGVGSAWIGFGGLFGLLILGPAGIAVVRSGARWIAATCERWRKVERGSHDAGIFRALQSVLKKHGVHCADHSTATELATLAAARLRMPLRENQTPSRPLAAILAGVVAGYHQVRFGGTALTPDEELQLQHSLEQLRHAELTSVPQTLPKDLPAT